MASAGEPLRICLVGATGLVGSSLLRIAVGRDDVRIVAVSRREAALPPGARMEMRVAPPEQWSSAIAQAGADVLVSALGTTRRKVDGDEQAFRAVDHELVLDVARAAMEAGVDRMIAVSSVGADTGSRNFYLRTKGDTDDALAKMGFRRLDILRPGLLRGPRAESRPLERVARIASPFTDLLLRGNARRYRSIPATTVALAMIGLSKERAYGRFVHEHDALVRAARRAGG